jgi:uncharacterized protein with GYD domain
MPPYHGLFRYNVDGAPGLLKDKASGREAAMRKGFASTGGEMQALYWSINGEYSAATVVEFPDNLSATAFEAAISASGAFERLEVCEVLTTAEMDAALAKSVAYRPPSA